jgi:hypothetical protein
MISFGKLAWITHCRSLMRQLHARRLYMAFGHSTLLHRIRPGCNATPTAIIAYVIVNNGISLYHGTVDVCVVDHRTVHVNHGSIIPEAITVPAATGETYAEVAASIINIAIEANLWPPIAGVKNVNTIAPAPVARGPQITNGWRSNPYAGHPIVIIFVRVPGPIARLPDVAVNGAFGLNINRYWWWRNARLY